MTGCVQSVIDPGINEATIALLTRFGIEVVVAGNEGCCGSLVHHMGHEYAAHASAQGNIDTWTLENQKGGLDAIIITASGCGNTVKDYHHMLKFDPDYSEKAEKISALTRDISEYLATLDLPELPKQNVVVAYHAACSLQHGQKITLQPKSLLRKAGFVVREPVEGHLCCGSAGTYNMLQPDISAELKARKLKNIAAVKPEIIATGNIGCITQIGSGTTVPIVHTVELLNWAYGGRKPAAIK
jgi:glycolate oxidase iron-sulfur subunit